MDSRSVGCGLLANPVNDRVFVNLNPVRIEKVFCKAAEQEAAVIALVVLENGDDNGDLLAVKGNGSLLNNVTLGIGVVHAAWVGSNTVGCTATVIVGMAIVERVC